jgi:hypothetical protein
MGILETLIGLFLALLPFVIGTVARSRGRSPFTWGFLSVVLTPFGALTLLLILPEQDRGAADGSGGVVAKLTMLPGAFGKIAFGDQAEVARHAGLDEKLAAETREARVDQLIAERLTALRAAPVLNTVPTSATATVRPTFGKRR